MGQGLKGTKTKSKHVQIGECKTRTSLEDLCDGLPKEFIHYIQYCRSLLYAQDPDYNYLRRLMDVPFTLHGFSNDLKFDWIEKTPASAGYVETSGLPSSTAVPLEEEPDLKRKR